MEERKLNEKESLELIAQMIQNTKNRLETNCGMPFLFWGYTTLFVSLLIWFLVVTTGNYYWQYLWFLLPIIAGTGTYLSTRNQQPGIKTHLDKVIVSIRPRACFFPLFSFLPLWLHYNLNPLCVQY